MARIEKIDYVRCNRKQLMKETALGSANFGSIVDPSMGWGRRNGKPASKDGRHKPPQVSHKDAIYAMRTSFLISQPEVKTPELMAEYRRVRNYMKQLRRSQRGNS